MLTLLSITYAADSAPVSGPTIGVYGGVYLTPETNPLQSGPEVLARLGVRVVQPLDIEVDVGRVDSKTRDFGLNYHLWNPRLNLLWHFTPNSRADLFLGFGGGLQQVKVNRPSAANDPGIDDRALYRNPSLDFVANAGPGITLQIVGPLHLRSDLRWYGSFGADATEARADAFQNLEWTLGFDFRGEEKVDKDKDDDGILDDDDRCPLDPEDVDGFEDEDGCPEDDNDKDGIVDIRDECPLVPEDRDGFQDADGCPEDDNDKDGIKDRSDQCPEEPEDYDAWEDDDGCPENDNDDDGILDKRDHCINDPETFNDYQDSDGCPDAIPEKVKKFTGVIRGITFETNQATIRPSSEPFLYEALGVLAEFPDMRIEIQGHTDNVGDDRFNLELSDRRAAAVVDWFIIHGIDSTRLRSVGYGELRPIDDNNSDAGRAENRRVEFKLLGT